QGLIAYPSVMPDIVRLALEPNIVEFQFRGSPCSARLEPPMALAQFSDLYISTSTRQRSSSGVHRNVVGIHPMKQMRNGALGTADGLLAPGHVAQDDIALHIPVPIVPLVFEI